MKFLSRSLFCRLGIFAVLAFSLTTEAWAMRPTPNCAWRTGSGMVRVRCDGGECIMTTYNSDGSISSTTIISSQTAADLCDF